MAALRDIRDRYAVILAAVCAIALLVAQEGPVVALLAAASVLLFRAAAGGAIERWRPARPESRPQSPPPSAPAVPPGQPWYYPLTHRESEVALLVAQGLTNRQIASALHSERTVDGHLTDRGVDSHVQHIMDKLSKELQIDVNRRAQISAWVTERRPKGLAGTSVPR